jgi:hypothetical protein
MTRRFPPAWSVEELARLPPPWSVENMSAAFVVRALKRRTSRNGPNEQRIGLTYQVTAGPLGLIWREFL